MKVKILFSILFFFSFVLLPKTYAETAKDSDFDGIPDATEIDNFHTNPQKSDSDDDGVLDYQEILDGTDPNDNNSNQVALSEYYNKKILSFDDPVNWYISRISGITSFILFTFVICLGLLMSSKSFFKFKFLSSPKLMEKHQLTATFLAFGFLLLHIGILFFDSEIKLNLLDAIIPFYLQRSFTSSQGYSLTTTIGIGIIAFYFSLVLLITSNFRGKIISNKLWRIIHYSAFLFYILFLVHAFFTGSESAEVWMRIIYIISIILVIGLTLVRIFAKKYFINSLKKNIVQKENVNS